MCTDRELRQKLQDYLLLSAEYSRIEKLKKQLSAEIVAEMDSRNLTADPESLDYFEGQKIITSRLQENATQEGKQYLKSVFNNDIDRYLKVSLSRYVNTAAAKKI